MERANIGNPLLNTNTKNEPPFLKNEKDVSVTKTLSTTDGPVPKLWNYLQQTELSWYLLCSPIFSTMNKQRNADFA